MLRPGKTAFSGGKIKTAKVEQKRDQAIDLSAPELYFNRELSWLDFNWRVLHEALDERTPLLERLKFLAITTSNLDEFISKRLGGLKQQVDAKLKVLSLDGRTPKQQLKEISQQIHEMLAVQSRCLLEQVLPQMARHGIHLLSFAALSGRQQEYLRRYFQKRVFPILTPLAVDPGHPFPFISSLSLSLALLVQDSGSEEPLFIRLKVPENRPRWVSLEEPHHYVPLEQIIAHNLDLMFPDMDILQAHAFRVIRKADPEQTSEVADDLLEMITEELRGRRMAAVIYLEVASAMPQEIKESLRRHLKLENQDVYELDGPLGRADLFELARLDFPELKDEPWQPVTHPRLKDLVDGQADDKGKKRKKKKGKKTRPPQDIFEVIRRGDMLVHHPYHYFVTSVQHFIQAAVADPKVLAIKQTLYRTSGDSPIIHALISAAEAGKQVAVLVELKARFDEARNIRWARRLREVGAHVAYGVLGLKTHTKTTLVVREEPDGIRCYVHIGTGNYHFQTAELYTDLGLLSCRPDLGRDLVTLFNFLTGYASRQQNYRKMLVAPGAMRQRFIELTEQEVAFQGSGKGGHIIAKMNQLEDPEMIRALYRASQGGVKIDLIVRGLCRLRPGVPGVSDNIRVISIVGRFLEHSRIFYFHHGGDELFFIGSADWMKRNLDDRVEAITPVEDPRLRKELRQMLDIMLADNRQAWDLHNDGTYVQRRPAEGELPRGTHATLMALARDKSSKKDNKLSRKGK
jgi:polyphosphate kinase